MTLRSRQVEVAYRKYQRKNSRNGCDFCAFRIGLDHIIRETELFWVVKNLFPYSIWEGVPVVEHLMVVPKRHVESLHLFTPKELREYANLVAEYDNDGYSSYTRTHHSPMKSVTHQHTHLIKLSNIGTKMSVYLEKPYLLWYR